MTHFVVDHGNNYEITFYYFFFQKASTASFRFAIFCIEYFVIAAQFLLTFLSDTGKERTKSAGDPTEEVPLIPVIDDEPQQHGLEQLSHANGDSYSTTARDNPQDEVSFPSYVYFGWVAR